MTMSKILSIAGITIRTAIRSRVVVTLLALLVLVIVGLPLTVQGDGTLSGHVQIVLNYTLSLAGLLLAVVTIWIGCAAVSMEIQQRQIHLVVTKPVYARDIWLGKWLGIVLMDALLVCFAGAITLGLLYWTTRPAKLTVEESQRLREEILVARREILPEPLDLRDEARTLLNERRRQGVVPADITPEDALDTLQHSLLIRAHSIPSGFKRGWTFRLPRKPSPEHPLFLEYHFSSSDQSRNPIAGVWMAGPAANDMVFDARKTATPGGVYSVQVPPSAVGSDGTLVIEYANVNPVPITVVFPLEDGIKLYLREGSFMPNFGRALLLQFSQLAFLAAVGLAAGTFFSMPVAAFTSVWIVLLVHISGYLQSMAGKEVYFTNHGEAAGNPGLLDYFFHFVFRFLNVIVRPLEAPRYLEMLTGGELITWTLVLDNVLFRIVVYSGLLAAAGAWVLSRREIALPANN
jgi:hypothetical protein